MRGSSPSNRSDAASLSLRTLRTTAWIAVLMFLSRLIGFLRDINTAAVMGMSGSVVMDAFVTAFRLPNLFRRLFEEGAIGLSWIPRFSATWQNDRAEGWRELGEFLRLGAWCAFGLVVVGESLSLGALFYFYQVDSPNGEFSLRAIELTMVLLPFLFFMILSAQCAATLQGMNRFGLAAAMPLVLNMFWLVALTLISPCGVWVGVHVSLAPSVGLDPLVMSPEQRAVLLSVVIVFASSVQFFLQAGYLFWLKRRDMGSATGPPREKDRLFSTVWPLLCRILPTALGLLFVQINTLAATLLVGWGGGIFFTEANAAALRGGASAIYFAERLYELPLGLIGVTVGTAFYPLLVRHGAEQNRLALSTDLSLAVRTILFWSIPAAVGLGILADPLAMLIYQRGEFGPDDARRCAALIGRFAWGVPFFCLLPILIRTFYALGDITRPMIAGGVSTLFFGLFVATFSIFRIFGYSSDLTEWSVLGIVFAAAVQSRILWRRLRTQYGVRADKRLGFPMIRVIFATGMMGVGAMFAQMGVQRIMSPSGVTTDPLHCGLVEIVTVIGVSLPIYFGITYLLGRSVSHTSDQNE